MSKVAVTKDKLDYLANAISAKSGESLTLTIDEMIEAVDGIETGGAPTLETVTKTYTPSTSAVTDTITPSSGYDGIEEVDVTVSAVPVASPEILKDYGFYTDNGIRKWRVRGEVFVDSSEGYDEGYISEGTYYGSYSKFSAIATGTSITPTESAQTIGGTATMLEGAVTVNAIPSNYVGSGITRRDSTDLSASGATVSVPAGYYSAQASKAVANGTEGTPTATKGAVNNHAITVTPSVTNTTGWITGSTKTGTAVTVSASELVSGNLPITQNGNNIDCANYSTVSVNVSGGGSNPLHVASKSATISSASSYITFSSLLGEPTSFVIIPNTTITPASTRQVAAVEFDGTNLFGQLITNTSNEQVTYSSSMFEKTYSNNTLTIIASGANFPAATYFLTYTYGGGTVDTTDVQVGSGATSITFTGLEDEPAYWSCAFKSNFGTSSGYQRVIAVATIDDEGSQIVGGLEMDSSAKYSSSHWTASYSNGSLTITSSGTNAGGYFHQPGYYQLTYAYDDGSGGNYQSKTVTPTTSQQVVQADSGYDALKKVTVNAIPSSYVQPTSTVGSTTYRASTSNQTIQGGTYHSAAATIAAVSQTNLSADNIKSGTTITISNGQSNLWSVTGTYSGGGGGSANIATETMTNSSNQNTSISFTLPSGRTPKAFFARLTSQIARNSNSRYYYVFDMRWDGSSTGGVAGNTFYMSSGTLTNVTSGYSYSQSGTTFTLSSTGSRSASPGSFYNGTYELVYVY